MRTISEEKLFIGVARSIFNAASQKMSVEDFSNVTNAMPEVQSLMNAAPTANTGSGTLGGLPSITICILRICTHG